MNYGAWLHVWTLAEFELWTTKCLVRAYWNASITDNRVINPRRQKEETPRQNTTYACENYDARTMKCEKWSLYCESRSQRPFDLSLKSA